MTTTPVNSPPSRRSVTVEEYRRRLAEDSPRGEFLRRMRGLTRATMGLEPLCPECEEADRSEAEGRESGPAKDE